MWIYLDVFWYFGALRRRCPRIVVAFGMTSVGILRQRQQVSKGRGRLLRGGGRGRAFQSSTPITISSIRTPRGQDLRSYIVLLVVLEFLRFPLPFRGGFSGAFHTASILLTTSFANGVIEIIENALRISHSNGRLLSQQKMKVRNGGRTEDLVG